MVFNYFTISSLINALTSFGFCLFVLSRNPRSQLNRSFSFFAFFVGFWAINFFFAFSIQNKLAALFFHRALMAGAIFIPTTFFHFVCILLGIHGKKKGLITFAYIASFIFLLSDFTPLFIPSVSKKLFFEYFENCGPMYHPFMVMFTVFTFYSHYLLFKGFRSTVGVKANQIKYIFTGTLIGFIGGGTSFFLVYNIPIPPFGNCLVAVYIVMVAIAIIRFRLMDIRVAFTRAGIFLVVYTFVLGLPFIVLQRTGSGLLATSLAVVFATMGPIIYRFLQKKAEDIVLAKQRNYQRILLQAATTMVTEHNLLKLSRLIVYILKRAINLKFTAIFVRNRESKAYSLTAMRGAISAQARNTILNEKHPFIGYVKENNEPFFAEEIPLYIKDSLNLPIEVKIVIPAFAGDELLAFVLLGDKVNNEPYTKEDVDVFKILSRQATLAIQNCEFFEESKNYQQRMFSAERLASIGGMADGVAHQIKNRLNHFSLASGEIKNEIEDFYVKHPDVAKSDPELKKTFDYLEKISSSLIENVKRTDGVIKGILEFSKVENKENFFSNFALKEITDLAFNLLIIKHETAHLPISLDFGTKGTIYGVKAQLTEVIYNLLDNAYEALKEKKAKLSEEEARSFTPAIELKLVHTPELQMIKIVDNGIGIKEEDKHKIFAPFFTTKSSYKSGSGIGVYVVKRIIEENHKGKIWFTSSYMKGTEFFIELPKGK